MNPYELRAKAYVEGRELTSEELTIFRRRMRLRTTIMSRILQLQAHRQRVTPELLNHVVDL